MNTRYYILNEDLSFREELPFPACKPTCRLTMEMLRFLWRSAAKELEVNDLSEFKLHVLLSKEATHGPLMSEDRIVLVTIDAPIRSDFRYGEWVEASVGTPEYKAAQYEDAVIIGYAGEEHVLEFRVRFLRVLSDPEIDCDEGVQKEVESVGQTPEPFTPPDTAPPRRIVCAAMMHRETGRVMTGVRHYCPLMRAQMEASEGIAHWRNCDQGFVDQYGKFHTREEAWKIAEEQGQIREVSGTRGTLYSEDLY